MDEQCVPDDYSHLRMVFERVRMVMAVTVIMPMP